MVKRRNRKLETIIDATLSTPTTGVQYYRTTLKNSFDYTDGFASSIWPMGTNVTFHNTGTSTGGDFGELTKLNYDNIIELYTPDTWKIGATGVYLSSSYPVTGGMGNEFGGTASDGTAPGSQIISFCSGTTGSVNVCFGNNTAFTSSNSWYIPEGKEGHIEFTFSSSGETMGNSETNRGMVMLLVPTGTAYIPVASGACDTGLSIDAYLPQHYSVGMILGDFFPTNFVRAPTYPTWPAVPFGSYEALDSYGAFFSGSAPPVPHGFFMGPTSRIPNIVGGSISGYNKTSVLQNKKWRISRKYDSNLYGNWFYQWQTQSGSACWETWAKLSLVDIEDVTLFPESLLSSSVYGVIDFPDFQKLSEKTSSCVEPSITYFETGSWGRSQYSTWPTASITYCYPAGFITNDSDTYRISSQPATGYNLIYKDYGLLWNVTEDRVRVLGERRYPFFNSYEDFSSDIRYIGKSYSIIPEFTVSDHIDDMILSGTTTTNFGFLTLEGAEITSSGEGFYSVQPSRQGERPAGTNKLFYEDYSDSDFQSDLDLLTEQHVSNPEVGAELSSITISCDAILKLLPYEGFYPITRTTQLASLFSSSIDFSGSGQGYNVELLLRDAETQCWTEVEETSSVNEDYNSNPRFRGIRTQGIATPLFGPGILYNSIKSGISVGWTIVTSSVLQDAYQMFNESPQPGSTWINSGTLDNIFLNTTLYQNPAIAEKIGFEALWKMSSFPKADLSPTAQNTAGAFHVNIPEALQGYFTSSSGTGSFVYTSNDNFMVRLRNVGSPTYEMAMGNFLSETVRFFLRDREGVDADSNPDKPGQLSSLKSFTPAQINGLGAERPIQGATYYMDVVVDMFPNEYVMCESYWNKNRKYYNQMPASGTSVVNLGPDDVLSSETNTPVNFSASFDGRYFGPATKKWYNYWNADEPVSGAHYNVSDPAQAPFTPPYFYGPSRVTLEYTAGDEWQNTNTDVFAAIFNKITASYYNPSLETLIAQGNLNNAFSQTSFNTSSFAYAMAQNVGDALDLFGTTNEPQTQEGATSEDPITFTNIFSPETTRWVISPKWECPVLNFKDEPSSTLTINGGLHPTCSFSASNGFLSGQPIGTGRGMWSGYGVQDDTNQGVRIRLDNSPQHSKRAQLRPALGVTPAQTYNNSLLKLMGFKEASGNEDQIFIGKLAEARNLSEAVVAIPYVETPNNTRNSPYARTTTRRDVYFECYDDRFFFKINRREIFKANGNLKIDREDYVGDLIRNMQKFIMPPQFDFIKNKRIIPITMYIFPFTTTLQKQDLQDIWQGVLPTIGVSAEKDTSSITHPLGRKSPFFNERKIPPNIKWMVFKIKQRGIGDYSKVTTKMDDASSNLIRRSEIFSRDYTYNWPYDFCSLIELGRIQTTFTISKS